jgi:hypothetical protein
MWLFDQNVTIKNLVVILSNKWKDLKSKIGKWLDNQRILRYQGTTEAKVIHAQNLGHARGYLIKAEIVHETKTL